MKDNCFNEFDPNALNVEEALSRILKSIASKKDTELVPLKESYGRVLAKDIKSNQDIPNYKNSAMDGYAVCMDITNSNNKYTFRCVGESFAGRPYNKNVKINEAVKVMTGGMVPKNCNAVVMKELVKNIDDKIVINANIFKDQNIRFPGEDIKKNATVLLKGKQIDDIDMGVLASLGKVKIPVYSKPVIGFFSTGDELVSIDTKIKKTQVYDSNRYLLHGLLQKYPIKIKDFGVVKDKLISVEKKLVQASNECDLLLTTGGVSVGDADFIKNALEKLGKVNFWKIAVKPGRPLAFGKIKKCFFFGLPGNPVSVVVTFNLFVTAAIRKITGQKNSVSLTLTAKLQSEIKKRKGRKEYKRGILTVNNGEFFVKSSGAQGSNILSSLKDANCYIELAENIDKIKEGENVKVIPFVLSSEHYE
jgi:molybdopterin molybdotransferase